MTKEELNDLLLRLHYSTFRNEKQIRNSETCGCFYCETIFKPEEVNSWCDGNEEGDRTALCPKCGMDSVIGDACGYRVNEALLNLMYRMFFGGGVDDVTVNVVKDNDGES